MLAIMCAKDDMERMVAMNNLKRFKDEQVSKIEEEKKVAVQKVVNLTKSDATFGFREAKGYNYENYKFKKYTSKREII